MSLSSALGTVCCPLTLRTRPRRTIATAQSLYHRFHLTYAYGDFAFQDVSISCMLVACKVEDTLKKLREIQVRHRPGVTFSPQALLTLAVRATRSLHGRS